jgi:hypothetical protein
MIHNNELKMCLQELYKLILSEFHNSLPSERIEREEAHMRTAILRGSGWKMKDSPLFIECLELMQKDEQIKALNGKLVGTSNQRSIIKDNTTIIIGLLIQLYLKNQNYNQDIFNETYSSFEELFYSDKLRVRDSSRLYNFQSNSSLIELGNGINIRKVLFPRVVYRESAMSKTWMYAPAETSDFIMERLYERNKIVRDPNDVSEIGNDDSKEGLSKTQTLFELAISALRSLKSSAIFRDSIIESEVLTFHPMLGTARLRQLSEMILRGETCIIEEKEIPEIKKIFDFLMAEKDSRFNVAQRRLFLGMERSNLEDRLIDYMIGLEALYLPDGNLELSFRLSLRIAFLLYTNPNERKEAYYFIKDLYDTRSAIVHGKKYNLTVNKILKLEDLLRKSIKLWIKDEKNFLTNKTSNSGKLISEGTLSNLFFT